MTAPTLTPAAWAREAQRCRTLARLARDDYDRAGVRRYRQLAKWCEGRARG